MTRALIVLTVSLLTGAAAPQPAPVHALGELAWPRIAAPDFVLLRERRDVRSVPEPSTVLLLTGGLIGIGLRMRRRLMIQRLEREQ